MTKTTTTDNRWIETYSGHKLNVFDIDPDMIDPVDIAHALSMNCRFNGHVKKHLSVAEHSVHCALMVSPENRFQALMHDAAEAYVSDMPRPIKHEIPAIVELDKIITKAIFDKFDIEYPICEEVKMVDLMLCKAEARDSGMDTKSWPDDGIDVSLHHVPSYWSPEEARKTFLNMFECIMSEIRLPIGTLINM